MTSIPKRFPAIAALAIALSACSSLNPYVDARHARPDLYEQQPASSEGQDEQRESAEARIADVRQYARTLHDAYVRAVADQERVNTGAQLSLIPLAATAAGLGISGGSSEAITALGLTGAGIAVAGNLVVNEERQRIYLAGAQALTCIQDLANDFEIALPFADEFEPEGSVTIALNQLTVAQRSLRTVLASGNPSQNERDQAAAAMAEANTARNAAFALRAYLRVPGQILLYRIDEIQDLVNRLIQGTSVDLTAFSSTLASRLASFQGLLSPALEDGAASPGTPGARALVAPPRTIGAAISQVRAATADLAAILASSGVALDLGERSCISDFPNTTNVLSTTPSGAIGGPASGAFAINLIVSGGTPPYGIAPPAGVTVGQRTPMGRSREQFELQFSDQAAFQPINVFDANDSQTPLSIAVTRAE
ncbi:MAG: hypothetical protein AAF414_11510 [Pseudomonadota bacterium]